MCEFRHIIMIITIIVMRLIVDFFIFFLFENIFSFLRVDFSFKTILFFSFKRLIALNANKHKHYTFDCLYLPCIWLNVIMHSTTKKKRKKKNMLNWKNEIFMLWNNSHYRNRLTWVYPYRWAWFRAYNSSHFENGPAKTNKNKENKILHSAVEQQQNE